MVGLSYYFKDMICSTRGKLGGYWQLTHEGHGFEAHLKKLIYGPKQTVMRLKAKAGTWYRHEWIVEAKYYLPRSQQRAKYHLQSDHISSIWPHKLFVVLACHYPDGLDNIFKLPPFPPLSSTAD